MGDLRTVTPASAEPLNRRRDFGDTSNRIPNPPARPAQAPARAAGADRRLAVCPQCGHSGAVPRSIATTRRLRCLACDARFLARQAVGERPTPYRPPRPATLAKRAAVKAVLARFGGEPVLDDPIDDLFTEHA